MAGGLNMVEDFQIIELTIPGKLFPDGHFETFLEEDKEYHLVLDE